MTPPPPPPTVAQVQVTPSAATIERGGSLALTARAVSATGTTLSSAITWSSNAPTVATVDANGRVTGVAAGQATISASAGAVSGSAAITVVVPVAAVTLTGDTTALLPGATRQLSATPRDGAGVPLPDRTISWSSSAPSVAAVSSQGLVTALAPGQVTISASAENVAGRLTLTVLPPVTTVTITGDTAALLPGATRQLTAIPRDAGGAALAGRPVTWSSSAPTVATVSSTGLVTALAPGQVIFSARSENATGTFVLSVRAPVATVSIAGDTSALRPGATRQLTATLRDANGTLLTGRPVTWGTTAPTVALVSATGVVTAVAPGQAAMTATSETASARVTITVLAPVATIAISGDSSALLPRATRQLTATLRDANGAALTGRSVTWGTTAPAVATVSSSGLVTAVGGGQVIISASSETASAQFPLTVLPEVASITIAGDTSALLPAATRQLTATTRDATGLVLTGRTLSWGTTAPTVALVSATGLVTAVGPGQAIITVSSETIVARLTLTVLRPVASLTLVPDSLVLIPGDARSYGVVLRDAAGTVLTGRPITFSTSAPSVATVSGTGLVTAIATGRTLVIASSEGKADTGAVRVVIPESRLVFDRVPSQIRPGYGLGVVVRATRSGVDTVRSFSGTVTIRDEAGGNVLLGVDSAVARDGIAVFDELAIGTAGSYRLRASAPLYTAVSSSLIVVTTAPSRPTIAVGTIQRTALTVGVQGSARYRIPVTLRDSAGTAVAPTAVSVAIARGQGTILSGSTTLTTSNGSATFDLVIQGTAALTLAFSAPGVETKSQDIESPSDYWSTFMALQRLPADSVVPVGRSIALTASLGSSSLASAPAHAVTYELSWNPDHLALSADTTVVNASYSINRAQLGGGVLRVSVSSASPLGAVGAWNLLHRFTFTVRAGATGVQIVRITGIDFRGPSGELLSLRRPYDVSFRVP